MTFLTKTMQNYIEFMQGTPEIEGVTFTNVAENLTKLLHFGEKVGNPKIGKYIYEKNHLTTFIMDIKRPYLFKV